LSRLSSIALLIFSHLRFPVFKVIWAGGPVAAVEKYNQPVLLKHDIRLPWQVPSMGSKPV